MSQSDRLHLRRGGLTIVEMLVSLGIVALLIGLLLPAVQSSREAARRMRCAGNLHQLGLATQAYLSSHGIYPDASGTPNIHVDPKEYSALAQLLPYLDSSALYASINFHVGLQDPYLFPSAQPLIRGGEANRTALGSGVAMFLCPSDPRALQPGRGTSNYRVNLGAERWYHQKGATDGPFSTWEPVSAAGVRDGLSQTASFSEKLVGSVGLESYDPRSGFVLDGLGAGDTAEESLSRCASHPDPPVRFRSEAGLSWLIGSLAHTCYTHVHGPNSPVPDCVLWPVSPPPGLVAARSNHPGGVQVAMADGSVRFVKNSIRREVWKALGTRAGGEAVSGDE